MSLKIVKRIHYYSGNNREEYVIYRKKFFSGWIKYENFYNSSPFKKSYNTYEEAEKDILELYKKGLGGIIEIDGNIYTH